jgi:hypothetical protein
MVEPAHQVVVAFKIAGRFARRGLLDAVSEAAADGCGERLAKLLFQFEYVLEFPVVLLAPDLGIGLAFNQLYREPNLAARFSNATLDQEVDCQLAGDITSVI